MKPAVRIAALSKIQQFFIWTHDSIGVGEDGPTHQPIEQLSQFRALPNFYLWRPADGAENTLRLYVQGRACLSYRLPLLEI